MSKVGSISVQVKVDGATSAKKDIDGLTRSADKSTKTLKRNTAEWSRWGAAAAKASAGAAAAALATIAALTKMGMESSIQEARVARSVDGTIDAMKALESAAGDVGLEGLSSSLVRMNRRLGAAEFGAGAAAVTVEALNLNLEELADMDVDQRIQSISKSISDAGISSQQAARHLQNLGFEQSAAVEFFTEGAIKADEYKREIEQLGLSLSEVDAAKIEAAHNSMGVFGDITSSLSQNLAKEFSPVINRANDHLTRMIIEFGGVGEVASSVFDSMVKAGSIAADTIHGVVRAVKLLHETNNLVAGSVDNVFAEGQKGFLKLHEGISSVDKGLGDLLKRMMFPFSIGVDTDSFDDSMESLEDRSEEASQKVQDAWYDIVQELNRPFISHSIEKFVHDAERHATEAANAVIEQRKRMDEALGGGGEGEGPEGSTYSHTEDENKAFLESLKKRFATEEELLKMKLENDLARLKESNAQKLIEIDEYDKAKAALEEAYAKEKRELETEDSQRFLDGLTERFASEAELYQEKYANDLLMLEEAKELELLSQEDYDSKIEQLALEHSNRMASIDENEKNRRLANMKTMMDGMASLMNTGSRKLFEIGKAAAIASATISAYEGISLTMSKYPYPLNIGMAAAHAAQAFAQIQSIKSSSFSSGPNPNTFSGGVGAVNTTSAGVGGGGSAEQSQPSRKVDINIAGSGSRFTRDEVIDLINQINGAVGDGVNVGWTG